MQDSGIEIETDNWLEEKKEPVPDIKPKELFKAKPARAVSTFECIGLYWTPEGGGENVTCMPKYRPSDAAEWKEGFPLWFDSRDREYRGSLVHLNPGTTYEIELALAGSGVKTNIRAATWSEDFPISETVRVDEMSSVPLVITKGGTPDGYILYAPIEGKAAVIEGADKLRQCVEVRASYVIVRGLTLKSPAVHGILLARDVHDVVIEECDISGWGRISKDGYGFEMDAGIFAAGNENKLYSAHCAVERAIIQRNRIHHPRSDANSWAEKPRPGRSSTHPEGPQGIVLGASEGNHVIRFNEIFSDEEHCFNDGMGGWHNYSERGFPNRDTDIYGNIIRNCWDDAIESEGANCNVRIWGNFLDTTYVAIACATTSIGPLYVWRNVSGVARGSLKPPFHGGFLKTSNRKGGGKIYVFHNITLQPPPLPGTTHTRGATLLLGWCPMLNVLSRNNILHVNDSEPENRYSIKEFPGSGQGDYDYDLYSGLLIIPDGNESHGIKGVPVYESPVVSEPVAASCRFTLAESSPGRGAAVRLPNFNDNFSGKAPDIGAHESGSPPMEFGVDAYRKAAVSQ